MKTFFPLLLIASIAHAVPFHQVVEKDIKGGDYKLADLKGRAVLVVNIASQCGFTGQLEDLEKLHDKYAPKGLVVLGVPTNDFGGQTPEDDAGMAAFCKKKYDVSFPLLSKATVKGEHMRPLYVFLTKESGKKHEGDIGWNFVKFLVGPDGKVLGRWSSMTNPLDGEITRAVEKALPSKL